MAPSSLLKAEADEEEATKRDKRRTTGGGGGDKGEEKRKNGSRKNKHLQEKREKDRKESRDAKEATRGKDGGEGEKKEKAKKVKDEKGKKPCESGSSEKPSETQRERDTDKNRGKRKEDKRHRHGASARLVGGEGEDVHIEERRGEKDEEERGKKAQKDTRGEGIKRHTKERSDRHSRTEKRKRCRSRDRSKERKSSRGRHHERKDKKRGDNNRSESRRSHSRTLSRPSSAPSRSSSRETEGPETARRDSGRLASQTVERAEKREKRGRSGSVRSGSRDSASPSREGEKVERSRTESPERADKQRRDSRKKEDCERRGRSRHHRHRHHRRDDKERGKKKRKRGSSSDRSASRSSSASHKRDKSHRRRKHRRDRKRRHRDRRSPSDSSRSSSSRSDASRRSSQASATKREGDLSSQSSSAVHLSASPTSVIVPASGDNSGAPYTVPFSYLSLLASSLRSQQAAAKETAQAEPSATGANATAPPAASVAKPILGGIPPPPPTPPPPHVVAAAAAASASASCSSTAAAASASGAPTSSLSLEEQLAAVKKEIEEEHARRTQEQQKELDMALEKRPETPLAVEVSKESEAPEPQEASKEMPENSPNPDENYNADERLGDAIGQLEDQEVVIAFAGPTADVHDPASLPLPVADVVGSERVLHSAILGNLLFLGFKRLMPVQRHSIPIGCAGYDICGSASTGSGKTLAFLVPMASRLLKMSPINRPFFPGPHAQASPTGLILVPTRELALQIGEDIVRVCRGTGLTHILLIGGMPQKDQVDHINRQQIDIAVCTPGRLVDMCDLCKVSLSFVATLVLDEADVMLNMGFRSVIMSLLKERDLPDSRQTMLFSATYPADLMDLLPMVFKPAYVRLSVGPANDAVPGAMNTAAKNSMVTQIVKHVEEPLKAAALRADLEEFLSANNSQAIVFVRSKRAIHPTAHTIRLAGIQTEVLTGNRTQPERQQVFRNFRDGRFPVLVATSVAARGLDFPNVGLVINVDMPQEMEHYVHRIGRTGRAGRPGVAISYMNWNDKKLAPAMIHILKQHDSEIPAFLQDMANDF
ncbi:DEAD/DEAH box helicase domain-containing protein [Toxoplasma gondii TgCatPRC2]|uniref:DEAD/DEAH box helicase domain-containing protein n=3 Tax=Toxoplasma gondii TaxID=5811 RepID=A0A151HNC6_TOXGO|nr:DEAD/DEAH box helicase domain-containing protein [Toxoplasma gondii ME49]EPT29781.1 DEAD/DEAH box helicase domain-containing protein [Toxoplasma gondii ME49]KYF40841.1 DEAD/DEAH box helicase domain-containing protein [Toxoplasma gondii ARI]KYK70761.1 DEAD/DEAH box helicase domain-containing protein [Toxoplasma gondii TgCatPRC2]|eukprot:XP_002365482.1 DEAD/DEAH box helicase domain-containing protein [Toxoplasma gondii ME49]